MKRKELEAMVLGVVEPKLKKYPLCFIELTISRIAICSNLDVREARL